MLAFDKDDLTILGETPFVAEMPAHRLDDDTTPIRRFYVRNNGLVPPPCADPEAWTLVVDGEVERPLALTLAELKRDFRPRTFRMVLECGGNGRAFFQPPTRGNAWTQGGVGCAEWTGVPLADVLAAARPTGAARHTAHHGADLPVPGHPAPEPLSRGMPIAKALEPHTLVAYAMNGEALPAVHGGPLRLVVGGWPGSLSQKWLTRIALRDREHDGPGMTGTAYRVPRRPMVPGAEPDLAEFRIIDSMPVRSIVTAPADGARLPAGTRAVSVRGAAWAGDLEVDRVDVTADGGATWVAAELQPARNRYDWRRFAATLRLPSDGYHRIMARATDSEGRAQPSVPVGWNPQGYGCNVMHGIAVVVG
jgi:sulfite oxidase